MSDPSISNVINIARGAERKVTAKERDYWNNSTSTAREQLLKDRLDYTDVSTNLGLETATENAYQQDYTAKFNQVIKTDYDSLPASIRNTITESLIEQGVLPNPKIYKGIGHEFAVNKEVFVECDRCDEVFLADEDFDEHKKYDHGDHDDKKEDEDAEDMFLNKMNPDISLEAFKDARRLLTETDEGDLHRNVYFNGDDFPQPTISEPDDVKGKKGYDDNPNAGLYDNKIFIKGKAASRQDGSVTESFATEGARDWWESRSAVEQEQILIASGVDPRHKGLMWINLGQENQELIRQEYYEAREYEGDTGKVNYDQSQSLSDITQVGEEKEDDGLDIPAIDNIDFAEENIDYVYPTKKEKASEAEEKDPFIDGYEDDDIESDKEAVEAQIVSRKLHGYSAENIARELTIQYGVSHDEALEKVYSIEVSTNDKVANTFFGKRYNECTEAEKRELRLYSGSDAEDEE